jgi:hypothetical protein
MDYGNAVKLQEHVWLTEHYLRNLDQSLQNVDYLKQLETTHQHRRTASNLPERSNKLFNHNNESAYKLLKKS